LEVAPQSENPNLDYRSPDFSHLDGAAEPRTLAMMDASFEITLVSGSSIP
jgi:hypothetical protein